MAVRDWLWSDTDEEEAMEDVEEMEMESAGFGGLGSDGIVILVGLTGKDCRLVSALAT